MEPIAGESERVPAKPREAGWEYRRWAILSEMEEGLEKLELLDWVQARFEIERSQARRDLDWLEEEGYIEAVADVQDGRIRRVCRTEEGRDRLARARRGVLSFNFLKSSSPLDFRKGMPTAQQPDKVSGPGQYVPGPTSAGTSSAAFGNRVSLRQWIRIGRDKKAEPEQIVYRPGGAGSDASKYMRHAGWDCPDGGLKTVLKRNWIDDWYRLSFRSRRSKWLIQLTTEWDEDIEKVLFYDQLYIHTVRYPSQDPTEVLRVAVYRSFISQDALQGGLPDPIAARTWMTNQRNAVTITPRPYSFGLALELDEDCQPAIRHVVTTGGRELTLPGYGLIVEPHWIPQRGPSTFWSSLRGFCQRRGVDDPTTVILGITRSGTAPRHKFKFDIVGDAIEFEPPSEAEIDLDAVLEELASPERLVHIKPLKYDHCPWQ